MKIFFLFSISYLILIQVINAKECSEKQISTMNTLEIPKVVISNVCKIGTQIKRNESKKNNNLISYTKKLNYPDFFGTRNLKVIIKVF